MPARVSIRPAGSADRPAIVDLVRRAFSRGDADGEEEVDIVRSTWSLDAVPAGLELVAIDGDVVVGHVLGARADLDGREVVGVAPLAVTPPRQGEGIGGALMTDLLRRADEARFPLVALLGSPGYYGRFGFEPAGPLGIDYQPVGPDNPHFQVHRLQRYGPACRGSFTYCWEAGLP